MRLLDALPLTGGFARMRFRSATKRPRSSPPEPTYDFGFLGDPGFWRVGQIISVVAYGGTAIVATLLLWLFLTILSTVSPDVLKRRAAFTWIALPSLPIVAGWAFIPFHPILGGHVGFILLCWTVVFAALGVGTKLRWLVIHQKNAPDVLSLPLAAFLFSVVTICFFVPFAEYGIVPKQEDCGESWTFLSRCAFSKLEGLYFSLGAIAVLILVGMLLPGDSHLIGAYIRFRRSVSKIRGAAAKSR
jgi:hypothetical protein